MNIQANVTNQQAKTHDWYVSNDIWSKKNPKKLAGFPSGDNAPTTGKNKPSMLHSSDKIMPTLWI